MGLEFFVNTYSFSILSSLCLLVLIVLSEKSAVSRITAPLYVMSCPSLALFKSFFVGPGQVAQLVRTSSQYTKVAGSIPSQGKYKNQSMNT